MTKSVKPSQRVAVQRDNPQGAIRIIFAHGAGAGLQSDFMQFFALGLAFHDIDIVRFNFPYWQQFMDSGVRRPPNRMPELEHTLLTVADQFNDAKPTFLMGKSMGARVAFRVADQLQARGAIALGFPFHPVGKPHQLRVDDLRNNCAKNLVIQGSRDAFGKPAEVAAYALPKNLDVHWLEHGDHSFEPTKRSGIERRDLWQAAIDRVSEFVQQNL